MDRSPPRDSPFISTSILLDVDVPAGSVPNGQKRHLFKDTPINAEALAGMDPFRKLVPNNLPCKDVCRKQHIRWNDIGTILAIGRQKALTGLLKRCPPGRRGSLAPMHRRTSTPLRDDRRSKRPEGLLETYFPKTFPT